MPLSGPSVKIPDTIGGKPLPKQLRNTLLSVLFCGGLFVAYYQLADMTPIPPDTHITFEQKDRFRLDIDAGGQITLLDRSGVYRYRISSFAVRRILLAFHRVDWFARPVGNAASPCLLSLTEDHRKLAIRHDCETQSSMISSPIQSLEAATRFHKVLSGDKATLQDYSVSHSVDLSLSK